MRVNNLETGGFGAEDGERKRQLTRAASVGFVVAWDRFVFLRNGWQCAASRGPSCFARTRCPLWLQWHATHETWLPGEGGRREAGAGEPLGSRLHVTLLLGGTSLWTGPKSGGVIFRQGVEGKDAFLVRGC